MAFMFPILFKVTRTRARSVF